MHISERHNSSRWVCPGTVALAAGLFWLPALPAQDSPPVEATEDETVVLSPFEVTDREDSGYQAANTLAGSRVNTSLKDLAIPVQVYTRELLDDLGVDSESDLMLYSVAAVPELTDQTAAIQGIAINFSGEFNYRLRGLAASRTRDYFLSIIPSDTYNTERYDEARGSNSILFGLGGAGGLINSTAKRAIVGRTLGSASTKIALGDHNLFRAALDFNQPITKTLAVRVNAVYEDNNFWRPYDFKDATRLHFATTYRPNRKLTVRAEWETGQEQESDARDFVPMDSVSRWISSGRPLVTSGLANANAAAGISQQNRNNARITLLQDGSFRNFQGTVYTSIPDDNIGSERSVLLDDGIAPLDAFYPGPGAYRDLEFDTAGLFFEFNLLKDLYIEVAARYEAYQYDLYDVTPSAYQIVGEPGGTFRDGAVNPYQGMYYVESQWRARKRDDDATIGRITASYSLDLGPAFGRHVVGAYAARSTYNKLSLVNQVVVAGAPFNSSPEHANNQIRTRTYFPAGANAADIALTSWEGLFEGPFTLVRNPGGAPETYSAEWALSEANDNTQKVNTVLLNGQSYFWHDRIIATYGWRRDAATDDTARADVRDPNTNFLRVGPKVRTGDHENDTLTLGLVVKPLPWLSLLYNQSEGFDIPGTGQVVIPDGRIRPLALGEGKDYGIMLDLLDGKLFLRAAYFKSTVIDEGKSIGTGTEIADRNDRLLNAVVAAGSLNAGEADARRVEGGNWDLADKVTDGWEIDLTANLRENWRLILRFSQQKAVEENIAKLARQVMPGLRPQWESYDPTLVTEIGRTIAQEIADYDTWLASATAVEGQASIGSREIQANLFTRYDFQEGFLNGVFVGGGFRFSDGPVIGATADSRTIFYGFDEREVDLLLGYKRKVRWFGNEEQTLSLQFNARGILQEDAYILLKREVEGNVFRARVTSPTLYTLTAALKF